MSEFVNLGLESFVTPLAQQFVKECGDLTDSPHLSGMRCFECTEVAAMAAELGDRLYMDQTEKDSFDPALAFLPAPTTWIEMASSQGRFAYLLNAPNVHLSTSARFWVLGEQAGKVIGQPMPDLALHNSSPPLHGAEYNLQDKIQYGVYAMLAIINSPRVIGRIEHPPHRGLQKKLKHILGVGNFELLPWHEIKLSVATAGEDGDPHLTGTKALHFVRAFLRVKRGKLEHVRSHWRGDPNKGVMQGRYSVKA